MKWAKGFSRVEKGALGVIYSFSAVSFLFLVMKTRRNYSTNWTFAPFIRIFFRISTNFYVVSIFCFLKMNANIYFVLLYKLSFVLNFASSVHMNALELLSELRYVIEIFCFCLKFIWGILLFRFPSKKWPINLLPSS